MKRLQKIYTPCTPPGFAFHPLHPSTFWGSTSGGGGEKKWKGSVEGNVCLDILAFCLPLLWKGGRQVEGKYFYPSTLSTSGKYI
jgi:hypothetical protein